MVKELRTLTGLRGIAATFVVLYHLSHAVGLPTEFANALAAKGYLAVDVFFVLSGFVMGLVYGAAFAHGPSKDGYLQFLWKRLGRIYPLYLAVYIVVLTRDFGYHGNLGTQYTAWEVLGNFFMIQSWGLDLRSIWEPTWSLSTEFFAYLLFPLIAVAGLSSSRWRVLLLALACVVGLAAVSMSGTGNHGALDVVAPSSVLPLVRCVAEFSIGLIIFRCSTIPDLKRYVGQQWITLALTVVILGLLLIGANDVVILACLIALIFNLIYELRTARLIYANRVVWHLGMISYSIYLVHPLLTFVPIWICRHYAADTHQLVRLMATVLYLVLVWLLSNVCYIAIERPGIKLAKSMSLHRIVAHSG